MSLPLAGRRALAVKVVRIHVFDGALSRVAGGMWTEDDHEYASTLLARLRGAAAGFETPFSRADRDAVDALVDVRSSVSALEALLRARRRFGRPRTLVTRESAGMFAVEGPLRFMAASALL
jgi:hypothetical protein